MSTTQAGRLFHLAVESLGANILMCAGFSGHEGISELFEFQIDCVTEQPDKVKLDGLLGKGATLTVELAEGKQRFIHGLIVSTAFAGTDVTEEHRYSRYRLEVVPWLWLLDRSANCRLFQDKTVPEIIQQVFKKHGFADFRLALKGQYRPIDYCVQYRETDFHFVSRLMEEEGIFYFFEHADGKHTLVLGDSPEVHQTLPEQSKPKFESEAGYGDREDTIAHWREQRALRSGKVALWDNNFQLPGKTLEVTAPTSIKAGGNDKLELYDYPGRYAHRYTKPDERLDQVEQDGARIVKLRMQIEECQHQMAQGESNCRAFRPGYKFEIDSPPPGIKSGPYVLTRVEHQASLGSYVSGAGEFQYTNQFVCIPASVPYRPVRQAERPVVHGSQTAIVVGPSGEEIFTDKYGRVKVQFHWDREGKKDQNSSCWVRVAQIHAGKGFGGIDIPRIGDEVVVSFLEGDPDQPIVVGRVYHSGNMPPFGLPDKKVISGLKTKTYKGDGYNELIMDDSPGNELIRIHGQYDMDSTIEHDLREHVLNDRSRDVTNNETIQVGNNRTETVGSNESLTVGANKTIQIGANHTETIGSNMTITVGSSLTETVAINYAETVGAAMQLTVGGVMAQTVGAAMTMTVGGNLTNSVGGSEKTQIGGKRGEQVGGKSTEKVGGDVSEQYGGKHTEKVAGKYLLKSGASITLNAENEIVLKTGAASITLKKSGEITIKGTKITIDGSASIKEKAPKIDSEASAKNTVKGAMVNVEASAINTIKGSLVKIN